jgi:PAP2 superfamily
MPPQLIKMYKVKLRPFGSRHVGNPPSSPFDKEARRCQGWSRASDFEDAAYGGAVEEGRGIMLPCPRCDSTLVDQCRVVRLSIWESKTHSGMGMERREVVMRWRGLVLLLLGLGPLSLGIGLFPALSLAEPAVGTPQVSPGIIPAGQATTLRVASQITDDATNPMIATGVNLLRLDASGHVSAILGTMRDDGTNGDATAGDHVFTLQLTVSEPGPEEVRLQVSGACKGLLRRVLSPVTVVQVLEAQEIDAEVAVEWFDLLYDVVKTERVTPPTASRVYGIAAVALYEAVVPSSHEHQSLAGQLNELSPLPKPIPHKMYQWPTVANSALARVIKGLFPNASQHSLDRIHALEHVFATQLRSSLAPPVYERSVAQGQAVAEAILTWAATDGLATLDNCPYVPPVGPGLWEPTPPAFAPMPLQPCWGQLRPLVLTSGAECAPPPHPAYSEDVRSGFYANALDVYHTNLNLTDEQRTIAIFWADGPGDTGTPPGHWVAIMGQIAKHDALSLIDAAEGYARVGIAVADAFIGCWHAKYTYNLLRPVTYIRDLIDADWLSLINTPAFPEYTSGHSTQSGAVATVLSDMFGVKAFTDTTHSDHGLVPPLEPRSFRSFEEAAEEAALSRLYGGIHYAFGNNNGLAQGHCIGQVILDRVTFK